MNQTDTSSIRVLFISDHYGYAGGVIHGATRYFVAVLPRLPHRGVNLTVAFLRGDHPASVQLKELSVEPRFFGRAKWSPLSVIDVLNTVRRERIQVIHSAGMKGILTARIVGRIAGVPVIAHLHDSMPFSALLKIPLRWTAGWSAHTLTVSREVATFAEKTLRIDPSRTEVLANPIVADEIERTPTEAGREFRASVGVSPDAKLIGVFGRLVPVKGHDLLLRAMPGVLAKLPSAKLLLVGDGEERQSLEIRSRELDLSSHVIFTGHVTDVYAALRAVDVCAIPSYHDGLPYSLLEAMAMGIPVVASAVGGLSETLRNCENGVLVRPNDVEALTSALVTVLSDPLLVDTIIRGGRDTIRDFDVANHIDRVVTIYRALAAGDAVPS